jgi:hypothetical protein
LLLGHSPIHLVVGRSTALSRLVPLRARALQFLLSVLGIANRYLPLLLRSVRVGSSVCGKPFKVFDVSN